MSLAKDFTDSERDGFIKQIADKLYLGIQNIYQRGKARRWIWELVQNAKDADNQFGPVEIRITLTPDELLFEHNGDPFEIKALTGLLQQVSFKSSRPSENKTTGKFGTGFITTHMLSRVVKVEGLLQYTGGIKRFNFELDRNAESPEELIEKIKISLVKKDELADDIKHPPLNELESQRNSTDFDTRFSYALTPSTHRHAMDGVNDLHLTGPYTLLFNKRIKSYTLFNDGQQLTIERDKNWVGADGINYFNVRTVTDAGNVVNVETLAYFDDGDITLALPVTLTEDNRLKSILPLPENVPTLFKDFPLVGSERWMLPMVCNSQRFEPTEPRDGLYLHADVDNESWQVQCNRDLIEAAFASAARFIEKLAGSGNPEGLYLLTRSGLPTQEQQPDVIEFLKGIQKGYREVVKALPLVLTGSGYRPMAECRFPLHPEHGVDVDASKEFYKVCQPLFYDAVPVAEQYEQWIQIVSEDIEAWGESLVITVNELLAYVHGREELAKLPLVSGVSALEWLNSLYEFLGKNELVGEYARYKLLPNQRLQFILLRDAWVEDAGGIPEVLKDAGHAFNLPYRDKLLLGGVVCASVTNVLKISAVSSELNTAIGNTMLKVADVTMERVEAAARICNVETENQYDERRLSLISHLASLVPVLNETPVRHATMRGDFNFDPALKALTRFCLHLVTTPKRTDAVNTPVGPLTLYDVQSLLGLEDIEITADWLEKLGRLIQDAPAEVKPLLNDFPIFPNQNYELCFAKDLSFDVDVIPSFLKDIHQELFPKANIRSKLLFDGFMTGSVTSDYSLRQLAPDIDTELFKRHSDPDEDQSVSLRLIDWLDNAENANYRDSFRLVENTKASIVLKSLPKNKEHIFRLLRLKPDFEKLATLAESEHLELLTTIAASGVDMANLNRLYIMAQRIGIEKLEDIVEEHVDAIEDFEYRRALGTHVENLFCEAFADIGEGFELKRDGFDKGQDFALQFPNGMLYRVEIKSFAAFKERVFVSRLQGETAAAHPNEYALCVLPRTDLTPTKEYFLSHARFISDIGTRLSNRVSNANRITEMIEEQKSDEGGLLFDSLTYKFTVGKRVWENPDALTFDEFVKALYEMSASPAVVS